MSPNDPSLRSFIPVRRGPSVPNSESNLRRFPSDTQAPRVGCGHRRFRGRFGAGHATSAPRAWSCFHAIISLRNKTSTISLDAAGLPGARSVSQISLLLRPRQSTLARRSGIARRSPHPARPGYESAARPHRELHPTLLLEGTRHQRRVMLRGPQNALMPKLGAPAGGPIMGGSQLGDCQRRRLPSDRSWPNHKRRTRPPRPSLPAARLISSWRWVSYVGAGQRAGSAGADRSRRRNTSSAWCW